MLSVPVFALTRTRAGAAATGSASTLSAANAARNSTDGAKKFVPETAWVKSSKRS